MINKYKESGTIDYVNGTGATIASGGVVELASRIGVAVAAIPNGESGTADMTGQFTLPAETGVAWAQGDDLFWDGSKLTKTSTDNIPSGFAVQAKASATAEGIVDIG